MLNVIKFISFFVVVVIGLIIGASYAESGNEKKHQSKVHVVQVGEFSYLSYATDVTEDYHEKNADSTSSLCVTK